MSQKSGKNPIIIVLAILGVIALGCCGLTIGGGFFGFRTAMNEINKSKPYVAGIVTKLSDANYNLDALKDEMDPSLTPDQLATIKRKLGERGKELGKFQMLTDDMPRISVKSNNTNGKSVSTQELGFMGKFEKGQARVVLTTKIESDVKKLLNIELE